MSFNEVEKKYKIIVENYLDKKRPPESIRHKININYKIQDQSIIIYTIRPSWRDPENLTESPNAKFTYVCATDLWKILWQRADLKWHSYEPVAEVETLGECLSILNQDQLGCFWDKSINI